MRKLYALLLMFSFAFGAFAQTDSTSTKPNYNRKYSDYENTSPWFFGLNIGATWHNTDVNTKLDYGFGGIIGRSFLYKQGSPIYLDARLRYLRAFVSGLDKDSTSFIDKNNALNGTTYSDINYANNPGFAVNNFQTNLHQINAELAIHLNSLRERKGIDLYIFGGLGLNFFQAKGDLKNDAGQYDYASLNSFDRGSVTNLLDRKYESFLDGSSSKYNLRGTASLGLGIGYQITPRISVGLEHKTTWTGTDSFDGTSVDRNDGTPSGNNDIYHYTSAYLQFNFKKRQPRTRPEQHNPIDNTNTNTGNNNNTNTGNNNNTGNNTGGGNTNVTKRPPLVEIYDPSTSPYRTTQNYFNLRAKVYYVNGSQDILFKQNGTVNQNFSFNPTTNEFQSNVALQPGQNIFEITATNLDGTFTDAVNIILEVPNPVQPPIVTISNPPFSPYETANQYFDLQGKVLNVDTKNQVTVTLNGQNLNNFNFNTSNGATSATLYLQEGQNTVTVRAQNEAGQDAKTVYIRYKKPVVQQPPVVDFVAPSIQSTVVYNSSFNILATVLNVTNRNQIAVTLNGVPTNNFTYNVSTKQLQMNTGLIEGANIVSITATNQAGTDTESRTIIYRKRDVVQPPVVTFLDPNQNPITVLSNNYTVIARVLNVTSASQIQVKVNGITTSNFYWSSSSKQVTIQSTLLQGANVFEVKGTNTAGQDVALTTIIHEREQLTNPPVVNINLPASNPFTTNNQMAKVLGSVLNIENANQITVTVNGQSTNDFIFNPSTKMFRIDRALIEGANIFNISATNDGGTDSDQTTIIYEKRVVPKPIVSWIDPNISPKTTHDAAYTLRGKVLNVTSKSEINLKKNGLTLAQNLWSYNLATNEVSFHTGLELGNNIFTLSASNEGGTASANTTIIREEAPCENPVIQILNPNQNNLTVDQQSFNFSAKVENIANAQGVTIRHNGSVLSGVSYNSSTKIATRTINLVQGNNVIQVFGNNECGMTNSSTIIVYTPAEEPCVAPAIQIVSPEQTIQTFATQEVLEATLSNIENSNQLTFTINGQVKPFSFDQATKLFSANASLNMGLNQCVLTATNECGNQIKTWTITRAKCVNPTVVFTNTQGDSYAVEATNFLGIANVSGVDYQNQITVSHNGQNIAFSFNGFSKQLSFTRAMNMGINTFVVTATNECGTFTKTLRITRLAPQNVTPPTVNINNPRTSTFTTSNQSYNVFARVDNVTSKSNIQVWINGTLTQAFTYNSISKSVNVPVTLKVGANIIKVKATNPGGSNEASVTINRTGSKFTAPPKIKITSPTSKTFNTKSTSVNFSGEVIGVSKSTDVKIYINNKVYGGFKSNISNEKMTFSIPLKLSAKSPSMNIRIVANNSIGSHQDTRTIKYIPPAVSKPTGTTKTPIKQTSPTKTPTKNTSPVKSPTKNTSVKKTGRQ